jgi:hypothetical protein
MAALVIDRRKGGAFGVTLARALILRADEGTE